jgi:hypothetical protein
VTDSKLELESTEFFNQEMDNIKKNLLNSSNEVQSLLNEAKSNLDNMLSVFIKKLIIDEDYVVSPKLEFTNVNGSYLALPPHALAENSIQYAEALKVLVSNTNDPILDWFNDDWMCILFKNETFINSLEVFTNNSGYCFPLLKISDSNQLVKSSKSNSKSKSVNFEINKFIYGVVFDKKTMIKNVISHDFSENNFIQANEYYRKLTTNTDGSFSQIKYHISDAYRYGSTLISENQNKITQLVSLIESKTSERQILLELTAKDSEVLRSIKVDVEDELNELKILFEKQKQLRSDIKILDNDKSTAQETFATIKECLDTESGNLTAVIKKNTDADSLLVTALDNLAKANARVDTYSLDLDGHLAESGKQIKKYSFISVFLILSLSGIFYFLFFNGIELVEKFNRTPEISVTQLILSRLPIITSTALIIFTISALLYLLVNHIISLNTDRMNMLKASILAEQVSISLANEHALTPEQRKEENKKIKIDIIMKLFDKKNETHAINTKEISALSQLIDALSKIKN